MYKKNINLQVHYIPLYKQPALKKYGFDKKDFNNAENFYNKRFLCQYIILLQKEK